MNTINPKMLHNGVRDQVVENALEGKRKKVATHRVFGKNLVVCDTPFPEELAHVLPKPFFERLEQLFVPTVIDYIKRIVKKEKAGLYCGTIEVARYDENGNQEVGLLIITQTKDDLQYGDMYQYIFDKDDNIRDVVHCPQEDVMSFLEANKFYVFD